MRSLEVAGTAPWPHMRVSWLQANARLLPHQARELAGVAGRAFAVLDRVDEQRTEVFAAMHRVRHPGHSSLDGSFGFAAAVRVAALVALWLISY